jgi:transcriptional regulator with XRE-family HTH domain
MHRNPNIIGPMIAKLRYQRGWRQDDLVAKLQLIGCYMTRDILANIETRRSPVTDTQIEYFCEVFSVKVQDLFPPRSRPSSHGSGRLVGIEARIVTRRRGRPGETKVFA